MKLFLASEAKHPESMKKLERFVGGFKNKTIAYIPTAANGENPYDDWRTNSSTWHLINTLGANVVPIVLEEYKNPSVIDVLNGKDIIWVAGGMCGYLMYWIRRRELDINIKKLLEKSIYVGSSAGSMISGLNFYNAEPWIETGANETSGLELVDFDFFPHYEDEMCEMVKKNYKGKKMYLVKNGEAIAVNDSEIEVLGETRVLTN